MTSLSIDPQRGQIWLVNFDPQVGQEIGKCRPALVVSARGVGKLPLRLVVPITDWKEHYHSYPWFTALPASAKTGLNKASGADAFQIKSVALARFEKQLGTVSETQLTAVLNCIALCVGL